MASRISHNIILRDYKFFPLGCFKFVIRAQLKKLNGAKPRFSGYDRLYMLSNGLPFNPIRVDGKMKD